MNFIYDLKYTPEHMEAGGQCGSICLQVTPMICQNMFKYVYKYGKGTPSFKNS